MLGILSDFINCNVNKEVNNIQSKNNQGLVISNPKDIIYGQVLINPDVVDFGQITSDQERIVSLWNATEQKQFLNNINEIGFDGVEIDGATSADFYPLQEQLYKVKVSANGGNSINASAVFNFTNLKDPVLNIYGSRILIFDFLPNYANQNVLNYSYRTEIQTFYNGGEERHPVYVNSEMMLSNSYLLNSDEARRLKNILQNFGTKQFVIPVFQLKSILTDDVNLGDTIIKVDKVFNFEAGMTLKIDKGAESTQVVIKNIDEVNKTLTIESPLNKEFKKGVMLFPILPVVFQNNNNSIKRLNGDIFECSLAFRVVNLKENLKFDDSVIINKFDGFDILEVTPNGRDINFSFDYIFEDLKDFGALERITQMDKADNIFQYQFISDDYDILYFMKFFKNNYGRLKEFLVPSYYQDYKVVDNIKSGSFSVNVENNQDLAMNPNSEKRDYIRFKLKNGNIFYRKILSKNLNINRTQTLILNEAFTDNIKIDEIISVEFCYKCRFSTDTLSLNYYDYNNAEINLSFKTL